MILQKVRKFDWITLTAVVLLAVLGLVVIYSTTLDTSETFTRVHKQALSFFLGLCFFVFFSIIDYRIFKNYAIALYVGMLILLILVLFLGVDVRGARSWFDLGFYRMQPSELGKFAMIILLAKYFADHARDSKRLRSILLSALYVGLPVGLILLEPDLGTALVFMGVWIGMLLASGVRARHFAMMVLAGIIVAALAWTFVLADYQKERLMVFINPEVDPLDQGYNVTQSQIAVGSGGLLGKGLGEGSQSQLKFLPEQQTDFIFAATAEELGFAGSLFLLTLFGILLMRIIWIAKISRDDFAMFIAIGIFSMLLVQILVNVGMNIGIMPVTGIPLPLVSYGGSSILVTLALLGLVESIYLRHKLIDFKQ